MNSEQEGQLSALTALRFISACAVLLHHASWLKMSGNTCLVYAWNALLAEGYAGVSFFFVLSGFILTYKYKDVFSGWRLDGIRSFMVARMARIWPVHVLTLLLSIPLVVDVYRGRWGEGVFAGLVNLALLQGHFPSKGIYFSFNGPSWSLSAEMFFYVVLPFLLLATAAWRSRATVRHYTFIGIMVLGLAALAAIVGRNHTNHEWLFYIWPLFRFSDFAMGVLAGLAFCRWGRVRGNAWVWTSLEVVSVAVIGLQIMLASYVPSSLRHGVYYAPVYVACILIFAQGNGWLARILSHRWLVYGGDISYSFYMFHMLVIRYVALILAGTGWVIPLPGGGFILVFVITLLVSCASYELYETPLRRWARQRFGRSRRGSMSKAAHDS